MKISIASDHGGLGLKDEIVKYFEEKCIEYIDFGTNTKESCDYPDFAYKAALAVKNNEVDYGIVVCTTGIGVSIVANKVRNIRCALVTNIFQASLTKEHNNTNMLALGSKLTSVKESLEIIDTWLNAKFEGGRHLTRVNKIKEIEETENE
ncbi:MAG: ribose 5-phosphate isomerase B [bacterium]